MAEQWSRVGNDEVPRTGVNDHAWERDHKHPTAEQLKARGYRRRDAEAKLEQHLEEARQKAGDEHDSQDN